MMKKFDLISTEQVMDMLGFSSCRTIYKYVALGRIRKIKIGKKNRYFKEDVENLINSKVMEII